MKKNYFLIILISFSINAQKKLSDFHLNYDSIVNHTVQKKETIFSLSKKYGLSMNEIIKANPGIQIDKLKRRSILIIPLRKKNVVKNEVDVVVESLKNDSINPSDFKLYDLSKEKFKKIELF